MHENPEWEKARQALASISKSGAAGSSAKSSSNGPVASAQVRRTWGWGTLSQWSWERDSLASSCIIRTGCSEGKHKKMFQGI